MQGILAIALDLCARIVTHGDVKRHLQNLMFAFEGIGQPDPLELLEARRSLGYHRLNAHYREAHELAWSVFEAFGISDLFRATGHRCFAFLIDMDRLFELFVSSATQN